MVRTSRNRGFTGLRSRLGFEALEDRTTPASPAGFLDAAGPDGVSQFVAQGWAYDPDAPNASIRVDFYVDGSYGFSAYTGDYRGDLGHNWGYHATIPSQFLNGSPHSIVAYGIDVTGNPNAQLINTQSFDNRPTQGALEYVDGNGTIHGWGFDPNFPSQEVRVDLYVDNQYQTSVMTTQNRPDINGGVGNHGYSVQIPGQFMVYRQAHTITTYAVNVANPGYGGALNSVLGSRTWTLGDSTTSYAGLTVNTAGRFAGAIDSIQWGGQEFVNSTDHGREAQSAVWGIPAAETTTPDLRRYNPTEAGSWDDHQNATSSSTLTGIASPSAAELTTSTNMAYWNSPGEVLETDPNHTLTAFNTASSPTYTVAKDVGMNFNGVSSIIYDRTTFTVPATDSLTQIQFQPLIVFTNGNLLTSVGHYDAATHSIPPGLGAANQPVVEVGSNGAYAMAVVTRQVSGPSVPSLGYHGAVGLGGPSEPQYGEIDNTFRATGPGPYSGTFVFQNFIVVGSESTVSTDLDYLQSIGQI